MATTTSNPNPPTNQVKETAVSPCADDLSPGWPTEMQQVVHLSGDTSSLVPANALASLIVGLQADREPAQGIRTLQGTFGQAGSLDEAIEWGIR